MKAIYINCKEKDYLKLIFDGQKLWETRSKRMLASLLGEVVALIRTGCDEPMVVGYATVTEERYVKPDSVLWASAALDGQTRYRSSRPDGGKWFYRLRQVVPCKPYPVPTDRINHGRAWTEWKD